MNQIRLYIDEDASRKSFVEALRKLNIDVISTPEANNRGIADTEQLIWARKNNRIIYTFNVGDFCRLHTIYMTERKKHSGIIVVPRQRYSVGEQLKGLQNLIESISSEEIKSQLIFLGTYI
ncbi:conserved hypothetical protein [Hyella patelloides LEGE 07179]|uniref:DUF5615 domain-containing protein n=1 Tax=Hyella patelloides LEGE 07179 TaxID=945734 RepID=A0A563W3A7_9CYAN|nr:DUF5615 family PIN-like protein [Hyella patelloides]VEP18156.1 conserved hypothetical protein [Hyella patelloides LEGE 07179]